MLGEHADADASMTLQTNYKTMAHIKDQAQEYLDSAIKT